MCKMVCSNVGCVSNEKGQAAAPPTLSVSGMHHRSHSLADVKP